MGQPIDLVRSSARELAGAVRERAISASELCALAIARVEALDQKINAVVDRDFERARRDAEAVDAALARRGDDARPLLGVPVTVKESFDLAGHASSWGMPELLRPLAEEDSLVVERLRAAGAIVLGKTNVPPMLADYQANNPIYGRTNNPYDLARTCGGSSGGSAAAVAMGFSAIDVGSDIAGSIRVPAAFCGVFGHKPSFGIVPLRGHTPGGLRGAGIELSVGGPIARSHNDLALALEVLAGPKPEDAIGYRFTLPAARHKRLADHRVLILDAHPLAAVASEIRAALEELGRAIERAGGKVARSSPALPDLVQASRIFGAMLNAIVTRGAPGQASTLSAHEWMSLLDAQAGIRARWAELFQDFDIVLAPAFGTTAFPHIDDANGNQRKLVIDGSPQPYTSQFAWASMASGGNLPSTVLPFGADRAGLPLGVQAIGPWLEDRTTIAFAGLVARRLDPPKLAL